MIPYGRQSINHSDKKAVLEALSAEFITQGPRAAKFEEAIAHFCGVKYVVVFSSATAGLHAACAVAGLKKGDEAITSPISFAASANCILYQGARVRFADVDADTAQITADTVSTQINSKTKIIIPVDFTGRPVDVAALFALAQKKKIVMIIDAAHSMGASYLVRGRQYQVGSCSHADMTVFSFHPVKSMTTAEGGAVTTNNKDYYEKLVRFRQHGITKTVREFVNPEFSRCGWYYEMQDLGYNYRLTDIQCALGLSQIKRLKTFIDQRRHLVSIYRDKLKGVVGFLKGDDVSHASSHHLLPILVEPRRREEIFNRLRSAGIGVHLHYLPIYRLPYYAKNFPENPRNYPQAEKYFRSAITLPVFPDLKKREQDFVIKTLKRIILTR